MKARAYVVSMELKCPWCLEVIPAPSGSQNWDVWEIPKKVHCAHCNKNIEIGKPNMLYFHGK